MSVPMPPTITSVSVTVVFDTAALRVEEAATVTTADAVTYVPTGQDDARGNDSDSIRIATPPRLWWSWIAHMLMSPAGYRAYCAPHIADMHEEYFKCLKEKDEWGARRAVIRANLYAVPSWIWGLAAGFIVRVIAWFRA